MPALDKKELGKISKLYLELGKSMQDIADEYKVSLDAVVYFMRKHKIPRRTGGQTHHLKWKHAPAAFKINAPKTDKEKLLHISGAMLYWAEGAKAKSSTGIDFANSDPDMMKLFISFLRTRYTLDEKRLRCYVYLHQNQNAKELEAFWSRLLNVPLAQFTKSYVAPQRDSTRKHLNRMKHGLVHVRYHDQKMLKDMLSLIESSSKQFCVDS